MVANSGFLDADMLNSMNLKRVDPPIQLRRKAPQNWKHFPIGFGSGAFRGSSVFCTMPGKESWATVASAIRLYHVLAACGEFFSTSNQRYQKSAAYRR